MKLQFLGTGAAGSYKTPECEMKPGRRRCAAMLFDDNVLVDCSLQAYDYAVKLGRDPSAVTDIFLSHAHGDHLSLTALKSYNDAAKQPIRFWCHHTTAEWLKPLLGDDYPNILVCPVETREPWEAAGMTVTALPANHMVDNGKQQPVHFIFEKDGKKLYYATDGGWFRAEAWEYLRKDITFDGVIFDATDGDWAGSHRIGTHNGYPMLKLMLIAMRDNGMTREDTVIIADHFCMGPDDPNLEIYREIGMIPAYDGFTIEI